MQKTNFRFEALVHDDASTDNTASIIREYAEKFPDIIKPIYQKENQYRKKTGILKTILYPKVTGKYVAMCEGDDYWTDPLKLQKQIDVMEANQECQIVFAKIQPVSIDGIKQDWTIPLADNLKKGRVTLWDFTYEEYYNCNWTFHTSSFVFRSRILESYIKSEFIDAFPYGDMPLVLYNLLNGEGFYLNDVVGCYRVLSGGYNSYVHANPRFALQQDAQLIKALIFFDGHTNRKYHKNVKRKIQILRYKIDRARFGKWVYLNPRYLNKTLSAIVSKVKSIL